MKRPARWAALLIVMALGVGSVVMLSSGQTISTGPSSRAPDTTTASSPSTTPGHTRATTATTSSSVPIPDDPWEVVESGLKAWGRFAVSGHLEVVRPWFHPDGPQWQQFLGEAPDLRAAPIGPPPYTVTLDAGESVGTHTSEQEVALIEALWSRTGEPSQHFQWRVTLRKVDGRWLIWTVEPLED